MEQSISEIEIINFDNFFSFYNNFLKKEKIEYFLSTQKLLRFVKEYLETKNIQSATHLNSFLTVDRGLLLDKIPSYWNRENGHDIYKYLVDKFTLRIKDKILHNNQFLKIKEIIKLENGFQIVFENNDIVTNPFVIWSVMN